MPGKDQLRGKICLRCKAQRLGVESLSHSSSLSFSAALSLAFAMTGQQIVLFGTNGMGWAFHTESHDTQTSIDTLGIATATPLLSYSTALDSRVKVVHLII